MHRDVIIAITPPAGWTDIGFAGQAALNLGLGLGLALALGLLIGLQRGWVQRAQADGTRFAGVRTHGLLGLAGGLAALAAAPLAVFLLGGTALLVLLGFWRASRSDGQGTPGSVSATASLVALLTTGCGYLAASGAFVAASVTAGAMLVVLELRRPLHRLAASFDEREMRAIARFALLALVILPLLPNTPFGPFGAWRPRSLWLVVVLVSGFSFAGYLAARWLGPDKGTLATAATGSLVSSTAVTAALAARHRAGDGGADLLNAGIALASAVMFVRVMVLTAALAPFALPTFAEAAVPGMAVSLIAALWLRRRAAGQAQAGGAMKLRNPFDLGPALAMMALVMALTAAARWVLAAYGDRGLAVVLAITGTADVDSAIITLGSLPHDTLTARMAGLVIVPPVLLNTLFKAGIAVSVGGWRRAWPAAATLLASIAAAAVLPVAGLV